MLTKAMIMSAGIGTRLEPLTLSLPKPLIPVGNVPVMDYILAHLNSNGINNVIANLYYLSDKIIERYEDKNRYNVKFNYIKEDILSGTAGGVKKCQFFFDEGEDFLVLSGDGLTDVELKEAYTSHVKSKAIATMVVKEIDYNEVSKYGVVVTDDNNYVSSFQEKPKREDALSNLINTGIYIFNYEIFKIIPENTFFDFAKDVFPRLLMGGYKINTFRTKRYWSDIGSISQYKVSNDDILDCKVFGENHSKTNLCVGNETTVSQSAKFLGHCVIGNNCKIGNNVKLVDTILWNNVIIEDNIELDNCIIASDNIISKSQYGIVLGAKSSSENKTKVGG